MKLFLKQLGLALMVVGFIVYSSAVVSAHTIGIDLIDGDWANGAPSEKVTIVNSGDSGGLSTARWGRGGNQSGYDFLSATAFDAPTNGSAFLLGTFTHQNYPISAGTSISSIDLDLTLGNIFDLSTTFYFTHNETPNIGNPDMNRDIITLENPTLNAVLSDLDGTNYYFNLIGFSQDGGDNISSLFKTYEGQGNTAGLYAMITSEPINNPVPEPSTVFLLGFGLLGFVGVSKKRLKK